MVLKPVLICDRCGTECKHDTIYVRMGSQPHPSGNGYEDVIEPLDLCHSCLRRAVDMVLRKDVHWLDSFKEPMKLVRM